MAPIKSVPDQAVSQTTRHREFRLPSLCNCPFKICR